METATLYEFAYTIYGQTKTIYVEKGREHPDPYGHLTWGRDATGEVCKGDFNRYFHRVEGKKLIKVNYALQGCMTAMQEQERRIEAIKNRIRELNP